MIRFYQRHGGFSLIELITVVTIIGILASVAVPSYKDYVYSSKLAEGYLGVEALTKAQKVYFLDKHYFTLVVAWVDAAGGASYTPPYGGGKVALTTPVDPRNGMYDAWIALGQPIPEGQLNYFSYGSASGGWDQSATPYTSTTDSAGEPSLQGGQDPADFTILSRIANKALDGPDGTCDSGLTGASLGFTALANRKVAYARAAAPLKGVQNQCTFIVQTMIADGDDILTSPMITLRE